MEPISTTYEPNAGRRPSIVPGRDALLGVIFSLALMLLIVEVGVRWMFPDLLQSKPCYQHHPIRFWTLRPNSSTVHYLRDGDGRIAHRFSTSISPQGFRGPALGPKDPEEFRILILGDSFVYGSGVEYEYSIPAVLERTLRERCPEIPITVINAGVGRYCPWQSRDLLHEIGFALEPDLVLLGLFTGNDVEDTMNRFGMHQQAYSQTLFLRYHLMRNRWRWNFAVEHLLRRYWQSFVAVSEYLGQPREGALAALLGCVTGCTESGMPLLPHSANRRPVLEPELDQWYPELELGFEAMWRDILGIQQDCAEQSVPFLLFAIPPMEVVYNRLWEQATGVAVKEGVVYERWKIKRLLDEMAGRDGVPLVPVMEMLRHVDQESNLYIPFDGHLNEQGCAFVAEQLMRALDGALPCAAPLH